MPGDQVFQGVLEVNHIIILHPMRLVLGAEVVVDVVQLLLFQEEMAVVDL